MAKNSHRGVINQIISGDTIEIRCKVANGPPVKHTVILSHVKAPKLGRRQSQNAPKSEDEPFAWEARELLRSQCIGKEVVYEIDNEIRPGTSYGSVFLIHRDKKENLACIGLSSGFVVLRVSKNAEVTGTEVYQTLLTAQSAAKKVGAGQWGASPLKRNVVYDFEEVATYVTENLGTLLKAIVEYVRDGSSMQVLLLVPSDEGLTCYSSMILLTGIRTPIKNNEKVEPYALESQFFVESRMLQREVNVVVEAVNRANLTGSVIHPNGNIAIYLLNEGLAKCVEQGLGFIAPASTSGGANDYRVAEQKAKVIRKNIWKDYQPQAQNVPDNTKNVTVSKGITLNKPFQATVVEVGNGDNITVLCPDNQLRKLFLAHIRAPRAPEGTQQRSLQGSEVGKTQMRPLYDVPYLFDAREFLRKRLIGKKANVTIEYIQPKQPNSTMDDRYCCTVVCGGVNISEALVSKGLASVIRPRNMQNEEGNATNNRRAVATAVPGAGVVPVKQTFVDTLITAENTAKAKCLGIFNQTEDGGGKFRLNEIARNPTLAKQVFPRLQQCGKMPAVVEFITSPTRYRVFLTRDNMLITLLLDGIVSPQTSRTQGTPDEPFSKEGLAYAREKFMQRDVEVQIENIDRSGNFIGWLYLPGKASEEGANKKKNKSQQTAEQLAAAAGLPSSNLAVCLVAKGFATRWSSSYAGTHAADLTKAEKEAKSTSSGQWSSKAFVQEMAAQQEAQEAKTLAIAENHKDTQNGDDRASNTTSRVSSRMQKEDLYAADLAGLKLDASEKNSKELAKTENAKKMTNRKSIEVTFIPGTTPGSNGIRLFAQYASNSSEIERICTELNSASGDLKKRAAEYKPSVKDMCAALYSADNYWYRARIQRVDAKANIATVLFIDFGNSENIPLDAKRLAKCPECMIKMPAMASEFRLAGVQLPLDPIDQNDAVNAFGDLLKSKKLFIVPEHEPVACGKEDTHPVPSVSLMVYNSNDNLADPSVAVDAAEYLLSEGLIYCEPFRSHIRGLPAGMLQRLLSAQNAAKEDRKSIWRYGDPREDLISAN